MNISSIVVKTSPENMKEVIDSINALESCEVHFTDSAGKIIATIEGRNIGEQIEWMKKVQGLPFVHSAGLSYSYCEDELAEGLGQIQDAGDPVPDALKES